MTATVVLVGLAAGTYGLKAAAPMLLGGHDPAWLTRVADLLPAALLGALVLVSTASADGAIQLDARAVGVGAAGVALWRRAPFVVAVLAAIAATALVRLL